MAQLHLIKHSQGILIPATPETSDFLQSKCKLGAVLEAEYKLVRNPAFHRRYFALLNLGFEYWEPTRWGITQNTARAYGYKGDMKELPRETAKEIYMQQYWLEPKFDKIAELSPSIAEELCDTGVNMGPRVSTTFLQRWLTALNQRGKLYPDLKPDGVIGNITIAALRSYLAVRGSAGVTVILKGLNCSQGARYLELAEAREANEEFLFGWVKERVNL
ncbi:DUF1367 family protein [Klebsiella aerogenes]|uniref:DUF1367 family protein n=1 Tax=Klebsiella aerogenes TaxID=548 RepID=UPI001C8B3EA4|nr:DUF1367 family protein [Klebsiella aerogenes]MBX8998409.1 DUF1367 family protein [Klebsiella aerogenes]